MPNRKLFQDRCTSGLVLELKRLSALGTMSPLHDRLPVVAGDGRGLASAHALLNRDRLKRTESTITLIARGFTRKRTVVGQIDHVVLLRWRWRTRRSLLEHMSRACLGRSQPL